MLFGHKIGEGGSDGESCERKGQGAGDVTRDHGGSGPTNTTEQKDAAGPTNTRFRRSVDYEIVGSPLGDTGGRGNGDRGPGLSRKYYVHQCGNRAVTGRLEGGHHPPVFSLRVTGILQINMLFTTNESFKTLLPP